jgi:hypothetical protein
MGDVVSFHDKKEGTAHTIPSRYLFFKRARAIRVTTFLQALVSLLYLPVALEVQDSFQPF